MSDELEPIASWEDAQTLLVDTQSTWDTVAALALVQTILSLIPFVNMVFVFVRATLAAVVLILFNAVDLKNNMVRLAAYFNDKANWEDSAAYDAAMATKKEQYEALDGARWFTSFSEDEKSMEEFDEGAGIDFFSMWFIPTAIGFIFPILLVLSPFTLTISWWTAILLFVISCWFDVYSFIGLVTQNSPATMLSWMPNDAAPADAAAESG